MNYAEFLHQAIIASVLAGQDILTVYDTDFAVQYKEDRSPLTLADQRASDRITAVLAPFGIPVLSEEGEHPVHEARKGWNRLWVVDPLDGTKEFVKRNGEFTVNVALVEDGLPVLGVIYSPVFKDLYFAAKGLGAYKIGKHVFIQYVETIAEQSLDRLLSLAARLPAHAPGDVYKVVASRSHMSSETYQYIEQLKLQHRQVEIVSTGSSIKMCWVAEGVANEYPRFGPTMEWDTAAGQAILQESGCELVDFETKQPMRYNRAELRNNWFIAKRK